MGCAAHRGVDAASVGARQFSPHLARRLRYRQVAGHGPGPVQNLAVAMFAQHTGVDICRVDPEMRGERRAEPGGVKDRSGPDYALRRHSVPAGEDRHNLGHDVERIGRHKEDRIGYRGQHLRHDLREDLGVA